MKGRLRRAPAAFAVLLGLAATASPSRGDTALLLRGDTSVLAGRNFDAPSGEGCLFVNKRGVAKTALVPGPGERLRWVSRYGSVTFSPIGLEFPLAGINEAGLCIQAVRGPAGLPPRPESGPVANELQWLQYHLDRHRSVTDVLRTRGAPGIARLLMDIHYLVADRKGNAAVVEFAGGQRIDHAGRRLPELVLTESAYADSLQALERYQALDEGADRPAEAGPEARFSRAAALLRELTTPGLRSGIDDAFLALNAVAGERTQWSLVFHLPRQRIFWKTKTRRRFKMVSLESLDFTGPSPALMLPVESETAGGLNAALAPFDPGLNSALVETVFERFPDLRPPEGWTKTETVRRIAAVPGGGSSSGDQIWRRRMLPPEVRR